MGRNRVFILIIALALAGVAGIATYRYVSSADNRAGQEAKLVEVAVISRLMPRGTPASDLPTYVTQQGIPAELQTLNADQLVNTDDLTSLVDKVAAIDIAPGALLQRSLFIDKTAVPVGFSSTIPEGMQAISMNVDQNNAVAGFILPGDKVNFIADLFVNEQGVITGLGDDATQLENANGATASTITNDPNFRKAKGFVMENVQVTAIGANLVQSTTATTGADAAAGVAPTQSGVFTFVMKPKDVLRIAYWREREVVMSLLPPKFKPETDKITTLDRAKELLKTPEDYAQDLKEEEERIKQEKDKRAEKERQSGTGRTTTTTAPQRG